MIRKPPADFQRGESVAIATVKSAGNLAQGGVKVARAGAHMARGVFCFFLAGLWGLAALLGGLFAGDLATFIGVGAMASFMAWAGSRAFAKARTISG